MITTKALANTCITSHNEYFFFVVRTLKIYSLSNFQVYNTVLLTIITVLYIRSPELIFLINGSLYPLTKISPYRPPAPQLLVTTIWVSVCMSLAFLDSTYKGDHTIFAFSISLISLSVFLSSLHPCQNRSL